MAAVGRNRGGWLGDREKSRWIRRKDEYGCEETRSRFSTDLRRSYFQNRNGLSAPTEDTTEN